MRSLRLVVILGLLAQPGASWAQQRPLPDALDIFVGPPGGKSNVLVLLDGSSSMNGGPKASHCDWYAANYTGGDLSLKQIDQLKSTLVGCREADDGIIDRFSSTINLSVRVIQSPLAPVDRQEVPWDLSPAAAEAAVLGLAVNGGGNTPMVETMWYAAQDFSSHWRSSNGFECAKNLVVLVADGNSNGNPSTFSMECSHTVPNVTVGASRPELASKYLFSGDMLCNLGGTQPIGTYTIGIDPNGGAIAQMQSIAQYGGGKYYNALNQDGLASAFDIILRSIVQRNAVFYSAPTVSRDSFFAGRYSYVTSFRPTDKGAWSGNIKKICTFPRRTSAGLYDPTDVDCMLKSAADGKTLLTNPAARDVWTGVTTQNTESGGIGGVMTTVGGAPNLGLPDGEPVAPYRPRRILTWRPGTNAYVEVQPDRWSSNDAWVLGGERWKLINRLHGYSWDATGAAGAPVAVARWPYADPVDGSTALLRYGTDCETARTCWLVSSTNDGELHFIDTATGEETSALIPADLWKASNVNLHQLRDLYDQPTIEFGHRYYLDGAIRIFHEDTDGDGVIDPSETMYLVFGLGRAGRAYYQIPMSTFDGVLDSGRNPVRPLTFENRDALADLQYTWAGPWLGIAEVDGTERRVAVLPSGHIPVLDDTAIRVPSWVAAPDTFTPETAPLTTTGAVLGASCDFYCATGYPDPLPSDETLGPFSIPNAIAYRVHFSLFDLGPGDWIELENDQGLDAAQLAGTGVPASTAPWMGSFTLAANGGWSDWIYDSSFAIRVVTNGVQTTNRGYRIDSIQYLARQPGALAPHYPSVFMLDLDKWNGVHPRDFSADPNTGGVLLQIAKECSHTIGAETVCIDQHVAPALAAMTCPVSGEISVYTSGDRLARLYWGDECGQLWTATAPPTGQPARAWSVRRLARLNNLDPTNQAAGVAYSKDVRKIFRKVDLVPSTCPGQRVVGVYYGTGNVQRPTALDELQNAAITDGRDLIGVVWDDGAVHDLVLGDFANATDVDAIDPKAIASGANPKHGWYLRLPANERMLRDPLVFEGRAYFKTHLANAPAAFCTVSSGLEHVYVMDNCSAAASSDANGSGSVTKEDRLAWSGPGDVGSDLLIATPVDAPPLVSHANLLTSEAAQLGSNARRPMKMLRWWRPQ